MTAIIKPMTFSNTTLIITTASEANTGVADLTAVVCGVAPMNKVLVQHHRPDRQPLDLFVKSLATLYIDLHQYLS